MAKGRIDCYVQEQLATESIINTQSITGVRRVLDTSAEPAHIGFRGTWQGEEAETFIAAMDAALKSMMEDGTVDRIISTSVGG